MGGGGGGALKPKQYARLSNEVNYILTPINIKVLLIFHTKFQPNISCHFGEMDLNAWVDVNFFRVDINFQTAIVT